MMQQLVDSGEQAELLSAALQPLDVNADGTQATRPSFTSGL